MTRTLSPVLTGRRRTLWFLVRSSESLAASIRRRRCCGALKNIFLCLDGLEETILDHRARQVRNSRPSLSSLLGHGTTDLSAFQLAFRGHDDRGIVFETETCSIGSSNGSSLSHHDGGKDLFPEAG